MGRLYHNFRSTTSEQDDFTRLQSFVDLQASEFAATQVVPTADIRYGCQGGRGIYIRAVRGSLPPRVSDMLAVRIGQLTAEVFHLLDLQLCWLLRRLCHLVLAFPIERDVTDRRASLLRGRYPTSSLIQTHPPPSRLRSTSQVSWLYDLPSSADFSPGRGGLLQLLGMSLSPCCRFHPAEVTMPHRSDFGIPCCLRPTEAGSALGSTLFEATTRSLLLRPGNS